MATMIPDPIPASAPQSEKIIFEKLRDALHARNWLVFHSIYAKNTENNAKPYQIDFVILIPEYYSFICLEVKGGGYIIKGNEWYRPPSKPERSPLDQAKDAMFALKKQHDIGKSHPLLSIGCAVAFTDAKLPDSTALPTHLTEMIWADDICRLDERLRDYAKELSRDKNPDDMDKLKDADKQMNELIGRLMPNPTPLETIFHFNLEIFRSRLLQPTEKQLECLRIPENNDHCVIDGAAGTGKTVLAMELAKRHREAGETVALLCSNPNLSHRFERWARTLGGPKGGRVVAGTPATLPFGIFRDTNAYKNHQERLENVPGLEGTLKFGYLAAGSGDKWNDFIEKTVEDLKKVKKLFDYLIVDETQNLCDVIFLKLMDALLEGGLTNGRWAMFGDFTNQNIVSDRKRNGMQVLTTFGPGLHWTNDRLEINCRNTPKIAADIANLVNIKSPPMSDAYGPDVEVEYFGDENELEDKLNRRIEDLDKNSFLSRQIVLLSSDDDAFNMGNTYGRWNLLNIHDAREKQIISEYLGVPGFDVKEILLYSDVYDFQGLESEVVILVMPVTEGQVVIRGGVTIPREELFRKVLYTGMSRAKAMLIILAHESYKKKIEWSRNIVPYH